MVTLPDRLGDGVLFRALQYPIVEPPHDIQAVGWEAEAHARLRVQLLRLSSLCA